MVDDNVEGYWQGIADIKVERMENDDELQAVDLSVPRTNQEEMDTNSGMSSFKGASTDHVGDAKCFSEDLDTGINHSDSASEGSSEETTSFLARYPRLTMGATPQVSPNKPDDNPQDSEGDVEANQPGLQQPQDHMATAVRRQKRKQNFPARTDTGGLGSEEKRRCPARCGMNFISAELQRVRDQLLSVQRKYWTIFSSIPTPESETNDLDASSKPAGDADDTASSGKACDKMDDADEARARATDDVIRQFKKELMLTVEDAFDSFLERVTEHYRLTDDVDTNEQSPKKADPKSPGTLSGSMQSSQGKPPRASTDNLLSPPAAADFVCAQNVAHCGGQSAESSTIKHSPVSGKAAKVSLTSSQQESKTSPRFSYPPAPALAAANLYNKLSACSIPQPDWLGFAGFQNFFPNLYSQALYPHLMAHPHHQSHRPLPHPHSHLVTHPDQADTLSFVSAPKKKRTKVTDTRLSPRTLKQVLEENKSGVLLGPSAHGLKFPGNTFSPPPTYVPSSVNPAVAMQQLGRSQTDDVTQEEGSSAFGSQSPAGSSTYPEDYPESPQTAVAEHAQTTTLSPMHLRKAKLMFFYARYPNSSLLKVYFPDVRFNKNNTAQLVKWFSNFREFYYIQIEKYARQASMQGIRDDNELSTCGIDTELLRVINLHYNRNNQLQIPESFLNVVRTTLREFFVAIHMGKDQEPSWKKSIYKIIARMDEPVPEYFQLASWMEQLVD